MLRLGTFRTRYSRFLFLTWRMGAREVKRSIIKQVTSGNEPVTGLL